MFQNCTVQIRQKDSWLEVKLGKAMNGGLPFRDAVFSTSNQRGDDDPITPLKLMAAAVDGYYWWGKWKPGNNSVTQRADSEYTVGTAHRDSRYWVHNVKTAELHFVQRTMESGWAEKEGGPPTGYKVTYTPALELYGVRVDGRGIKPVSGDQGTGWVRIGNRMFRQERIYWEKAVNLD